MNKTQVLKFIGKARAAKIEELDVYMVTEYCGKPVYCIDAMSFDEWADDEDCHTFIYEGYDATNREMMVTFRDWIDELTEAA